MMFSLKKSRLFRNITAIGLVICPFIIIGSLFSKDSSSEYLVYDLKIPNLYSEHQYQLDIVDYEETSSYIKPQPTCGLYAPEIDCNSESCVALTFDDGPGKYTARLLDYLRKGRARATFYMIGFQVERYSDVVRRIIKEGHQIGNHSWDHHSYTEMKDKDIKTDINRTDEIIKKVSGIKPNTLRPPFGEVDNRVINVSKMPQVLWSVDSEDWLHRDTKSVIEKTLANTERGSIILLHDIYPSTVEAIPRIIDKLKSKGFKIVTINELLGKKLRPDTYHKQ